MKNKLLNFLYSTGRGLISFCLAYAVILKIGYGSFILFGEPKFPEI